MNYSDILSQIGATPPAGQAVPSALTAKQRADMALAAGQSVTPKNKADIAIAAAPGVALPFQRTPEQIAAKDQSDIDLAAQTGVNLTQTPQAGQPSGYPLSWIDSQGSHYQMPGWKPSEDAIVPQGGAPADAGTTPDIAGPVSQSASGPYAAAQAQLASALPALRKPGWADFLEAATAGWLGNEGEYIKQANAQKAQQAALAEKAQEQINQLAQMSEEYRMRGENEKAARVDEMAQAVKLEKMRIGAQAEQDARSRQLDPVSAFQKLLAPGQVKL